MLQKTGDVHCVCKGGFNALFIKRRKVTKESQFQFLDFYREVPDFDSVHQNVRVYFSVLIPAKEGTKHAVIYKRKMRCKKCKNCLVPDCRKCGACKYVSTLSIRCCFFGRQNVCIKTRKKNQKKLK